MTGDSTMGGPGGPVVVIGAGPAGLTAAYKLAQENVRATVLEADEVVGGISRTVERDGWRFDIGGHRFFTKVGAVEALWHEILGEEDFLRRERLSRILYRGRTFDYPLRAFNALSGLGVVEASRCVLSYAWARLREPGDQESFEGWVSSRFGRRLYEIFFKTYTEKVWGMPADQIRADWAAQRIRNLNLPRAIANAMLPRRGSTDVVSLIESFEYPRLGPGMMWERAAEKATAMGVDVHLATPVVRVRRNDRGVCGVVADHGGVERTHAAAHVVSSMPLRELVHALDPAAPDEVRAAADGLRYRDFLTVALVVPESASFQDNWIYIHDPDVQVGRIQNFRSWSPDMVKPGWTCLGLEYFVTEGDGLWTMDDDALVRLAARELDHLGLADTRDIGAGYVVRMPKAYPVYDGTYRDAVDCIRAWTLANTPNLHCVGRNGMHRYNNQDHSMLTAMLAVENILGASHDVWSVNVDEDYHEEVRRPLDREIVGRRVQPAPVA